VLKICIFARPDNRTARDGLISRCKRLQPGPVGLRNFDFGLPHCAPFLTGRMPPAVWDKIASSCRKVPILAGFRYLAPSLSQKIWRRSQRPSPEEHP